MSSTLRFTVDSEQDGQRIDKFLQQQVEGMSRSQAQKWLAAGQGLGQGKAAGKNDKLKAGMQVEVCLPETALLLLYRLRNLLIFHRRAAAAADSLADCL